jgi:hypothetical protein
MTKTRAITIVALLIYWTWFWVMFFHSSVGVLAVRRCEAIGPLFEVHQS